MSSQPHIELDELGDGLWLVEVVGEHDLASASLLAGALEHIAEVSDTTAVVDFSDATFIDSTVFRTLIDQLRGHPGERDDWIVAVAGPGTEPRRLLDLIGAEDILGVFDSPQEALRAVTPGEDAHRGLPAATELSHGWSTRSAVDRLAAAFDARDSHRVAELVHPDAVLRPLALGGAHLHGSEAAREFTENMRRNMALVTIRVVHEVGHDAAILVGRYRHQRADDALVDAQAVWAVAFRDGLMWRGEGVKTEAAARDYLAAIDRGH